MWIFGYGSLVWKAGFPYEEKLVGCVKGFNRRFYQYSTDHRGVPENPGRVVTLIRSTDENDEVWGTAYRIAEADVETVVSQLDYREKGGYQRHNVVFHPQNGEMQPFDITVYLATTDNFQYAGEADLDDIAIQITRAVGPSGTNVDYICNLANAMREIAPGVYDEHLFTLESKVINLIEEREQAGETR